MELIDKTKLLAEIKRRILEDYNTDDKEKDAVAQGAIASLKYYIEDTLEVKEINPTDAFIRKARKYFYKELPNFRSFMESGTAFIKNFESFIQGE